MQLYHLPAWQSFTNVTILKVSEAVTHVMMYAPCCIALRERQSGRTHFTVIDAVSLQCYTESEKWNGKPRRGMCQCQFSRNNDNNKWYIDLEHLICTNPKQLHILYVYTHTQLRIRAMGLKQRFLKRESFARKVFRKEKAFQQPPLKTPVGVLPLTCQTRSREKWPSR